MIVKRKQSFTFVWHLMTLRGWRASLSTLYNHRWRLRERTCPGQQLVSDNGVAGTQAVSLQIWWHLHCCRTLECRASDLSWQKLLEEPERERIPGRGLRCLFQVLRLKEKSVWFGGWDSYDFRWERVASLRLGFVHCTLASPLGSVFPTHSLTQQTTPGEKYSFHSNSWRSLSNPTGRESDSS